MSFSASLPLGLAFSLRSQVCLARIFPTPLTPTDLSSLVSSFFLFSFFSLPHSSVWHEYSLRRLHRRICQAWYPFFSFFLFPTALTRLFGTNLPYAAYTDGSDKPGTPLCVSICTHVLVKLCSTHKHQRYIRMFFCECLLVTPGMSSVHTQTHAFKLTDGSVFFFFGLSFELAPCLCIALKASVSLPRARSLSLPFFSLFVCQAPHLTHR